MDIIGHEPCKWEDLEHRHTTHEFWGKFGTYKGKHTQNKNLVNIHQRKIKPQKQAMRE